LPSESLYGCTTLQEARINRMNHKTYGSDTTASEETSLFYEYRKYVLSAE